MQTSGDVLNAGVCLHALNHVPLNIWVVVLLNDAQDDKTAQGGSGAEVNKEGPVQMETLVVHMFQVYIKDVEVFFGGQLRVMMTRAIGTYTIFYRKIQK